MVLGGMQSKYEHRKTYNYLITTLIYKPITNSQVFADNIEIKAFIR